MGSDNQTPVFHLSLRNSNLHCKGYTRLELCCWDGAGSIVVQAQSENRFPSFLSQPMSVLGSLPPSHPLSQSQHTAPPRPADRRSVRTSNVQAWTTLDASRVASVCPDGYAAFDTCLLQSGQCWMFATSRSEGEDRLKRLSRRAVVSSHWVCVGLLLCHPNHSQSSWGDGTAASIWGDATARRGSTTLVAASL